MQNNMQMQELLKVIYDVKDFFVEQTLNAN